jgi:hypothetical protein
VLLAIVWQRQARAARRWNAVVNAYADREIARARRFAAPRQAQTVPTRGGATHNRRAS